MNEQDHRIHNPELAHHMGYSEYLYRELAAHALRAGKQEVHDQSLLLGEEKAIEAGQAYIDSLQNNLDLSQNKVGNIGKIALDSDLDADKSSAEKVSSVLVSKSDFKEFAKSENYAGYKLEKTDADAIYAGRAWNSLVHYYDGLTKPDSRHRNWHEPIVQVDLQLVVRGKNNSTVDYDGLAALVDGYDSIAAEHPGMKTVDILGYQFGEASLSFIRAFAEHKKAKLSEQSQE